MKATVNVKDLNRAMREVAPVTGKRGWPITRNVLIEALGDHLRLTCFNLEPEKVGAWDPHSSHFTTEVRERCRVREIPARIEAEGATTVPAKLLHELARELKRGDLELKHEEQLSLAWGTTCDGLVTNYRPMNLVCRFKAIPESEFPALYRDIDFGDWGFLAPALPMAA